MPARRQCLANGSARAGEWNLFSSHRPHVDDDAAGYIEGIGDAVIGRTNPAIIFRDPVQRRHCRDVPAVMVNERQSGGGNRRGLGKTQAEL